VPTSAILITFTLKPPFLQISVNGCGYSFCEIAWLPMLESICKSWQAPHSPWGAENRTTVPSEAQFWAVSTSLAPLPRFPVRNGGLVLPLSILVWHLTNVLWMAQKPKRHLMWNWKDFKHQIFSKVIEQGHGDQVTVHHLISIWCTWVQGKDEVVYSF
jgi:hypothetical protein